VLCVEAISDATHKLFPRRDIRKAQKHITHAAWLQLQRNQTGNNAQSHGTFLPPNTCNFTPSWLYTGREGQNFIETGNISFKKKKKNCTANANEV
jgi:hypothetical protein